jgi:hypothetical protein
LNRFLGLPRERGFKEPSPDSNSLKGKVTAAARVEKTERSKEGSMLTFIRATESWDKDKLRNGIIKHCIRKRKTNYL